jgi:hypothetical protein
MRKLMTGMATICLLASLVAIHVEKSAAQTGGNGQTCQGSTNCTAVGCAFIFGSSPKMWRDSYVTNHSVCIAGGSQDFCTNFGQYACTINRYWTGGNGCNGTFTTLNGQIVAICGL